MATVTLLLKKTHASIGAVVLDASVSENHSTELEVTEHPVEVGANIADHKRKKLDSLTIEGVVSDTPLPDPSAPLTRQVSGGVAFESRSNGEPSRAGQAYQDLLSIAEGKELVTVVTALRTYENMAIRSLTVPRDARTGHALKFTATLVQVRTVENQTVEVETKAKDKTSKGRQVAKQTPEATVWKSWVKTLADTETGDKLMKAFGVR